MSCQQFEEQFSLYLYGELSPGEAETLEAHCAACDGCRDGLERERALHAAIGAAEPELPELLLATCRRDLAAALPALPAKRVGWGEQMRLWFAAGAWRPAAVALGMAAIGFFGGRFSMTPAARGEAAPEVIATRVRELSADPAGRVRLVLEETRQRTLAGSLEDEAIRQHLMTAAQDPADAGLRVESVDLLRRYPSTGDVRGALMAVLQRDPNPGVRLKAVEGLRPFAADPAVRRVLTAALERDENPGVRGRAVELLIEHGQKDVVDVLQRLMQREDDGYIRSRTQRALEAINASVETF